MFQLKIFSLVSFFYDWSPTRKYLNRQLVTGILYLVTAAYFALLPQTSSLPLAYGLGALGGLGLGNTVAIAVTWIIELWSTTPKILAAALQALQLVYGLGTIVGPLIVRPHLYGYMNATQVDEMSVEEYGEKIAQRRTSLTGPFIISASFVVTGELKNELKIKQHFKLFFSVGIAYLLLFITTFTRYRKPCKPETVKKVVEREPDHNENISLPSEIELKTPTTEKEEVKLLERPENRTQLRLFIILIVGIFACNNLVEVAYFSFQDTFLQALKSGSGLKITASEAAVIGSITATSYTAGRGVNILVSMVLSAGRLLLLHYGLALAAISTLFYTTSQSTTTLPIKLNCALLGYAFSAIMPAMFAFIDRYAVVNDRRNALFTVALTVPSIFTPLLIGNLIETVPQVLIYIDGSVLGVALFLFLGVRYVLIRKCKSKSKSSVL